MNNDRDAKSRSGRNAQRTNNRKTRRATRLLSSRFRLREVPARSPVMLSVIAGDSEVATVVGADHIVQAEVRDERRIGLAVGPDAEEIVVGVSSM